MPQFSYRKMILKRILDAGQNMKSDKLALTSSARFFMGIWHFSDYSVFFPAALALAQRAFAAAEILALAAALIFLLFVGALTTGFAPLTFAHRAF